MATIAGRAFDFHIFRRLLGYVSPYKKVFWTTALLTVVLAFLSPVRPWLIQRTLDKYILASDKQGLVFMVALLIVLLVTEGIFQFFQSYYTSWLGQSVIRDLRAKIFRHIIHFRLKYFDQTPIGTLVTRVISDIETIADVFSEGLLTMIGDILKLIVIVLVMFVTDMAERISTTGKKTE
jgi:ATP-binding cassette, subfamily B, multidrug efflux pump